jgi:penicillin-binding protein-related factor A (putative recombinase)
VTEAQFQSKFNKWCVYRFNETCAAELKVTHGKDTLPFSNIKEHQINNLYQVKHGKYPYKIADVGQMQKPFDMVFFASCNAYIVILFTDKDFVMIDIDEYLKFSKDKTRGSISFEQAKLIGKLYTLGI